MALVSELVIYPIKSCGGISLKSATLTEAGLMSDFVYDREWMVVDEAGEFITQRECPRLASVQPRLRADVMELRAPGMLPLHVPLDLPAPEDERRIKVTVWNDVVEAYDCDDVTATWFSSLLGSPARLARFHPDARRIASARWTGGIEAPTLFSDGFPLLVISQASLADLNGKLQAQGRSPLPMDRFRPNLVLADSAAFEEDFASAIRIGEAVIKPVKPCPRCPIPSVDQRSGEIGPDPLDVLRTYRSDARVEGAITFGMNAIVSSGQDVVLTVGQPASIDLGF